MYFNNCVEVKISGGLFDTAHKTPGAQEVETLKLQLSTYNIISTGETRDDACDCLMLLIEIMYKGFGLFPTNDNTSSKGSFSELLFPFVLSKYIICSICTVKSAALETTCQFYVNRNWLYLHAGIIDTAAQTEMGLRENHHASVVRNWYHWVPIAYLYQPSP